MLKRPFNLIASAIVMTLLGLAIYASGGSGRTVDINETPAYSNRSLTHRSLHAPRTSPAVVNHAPLAVPSSNPPPAQPVTVADQSGSVGAADAERLAIKFHNYPDLSGEYRVRADGSISVPIIGRVSVTNLSDGDIERSLAQRLSKSTGRDTYVTVEVTEYRSIFVTGYVARPGAFPWRPGMNVLQAMTLAGGIYRSSAEAGVASPGQDGTIVRLQKAVNDQKRNLATLARLRAEQRVADTIEVPATLVALVGRTDAEALVAAEATSFTSRRAALEAKRAALARATQMAGKELAGLTEQGQRLIARLKQRRTYKNNIDQLQAKGIVRTERLMEESARVSDLEDRDTALNVSIARVHVLLAGLERDRVNLEHERKAEIDTEIIKLERHIGQLDIDIAAARASYTQLTGHQPPQSLILSAPQQKLSLKYEIIRAKGTAINSPADQLVSLRPGDTIVVGVE